MGRGKVTPDETIELIKATYAMNGELKATSLELGVPIATVSKYVKQSDKDQFESVRNEQRADIIPSIYAKIGQVQIALLDALMDANKIQSAEYRDIGVVFGIVTDKGQLLTGEPTERHEHRDISEARDEFARRIDELAERRRARGADLGVRTG